MTPPKLLFVVTEDWFFLSHRFPIALAARKAGWDVVLVTNVSRHAQVIQKAGIKLIAFNLDRGSINPFKEFCVLLRLAAIYRREKPDLVHHVAIKPVIYGSIAARFVGIPHINALTGMGWYAFTSDHLHIRLIVRPFVKLVFRMLFNGKRSHLIIQNQDDCSFLVKAGVINREKTTIIRGAGVDTKQYFFSPEPLGGLPKIVLPARMLRDKGIREFVEAARILKDRGVKGRFIVVGGADLQSARTISVKQLALWQAQEYVELWGRHDNMPRVLAQSHIVCLPSYREGLPKALLEAASSGRPIVTTDTIGCREVVRHGDNGFLVPVQSTIELADALQRLIEDASLRHTMGLRSREIAATEFAVEKIVEQTMSLYDEMLRGNKK